MPAGRVAAAARPAVKPTPRPLPPPERCLGARVAPKPGAPPFSPGEELAYELTVGGMYVGRFETKVGRVRSVDGKPALSLFGRARTSSFLSVFQRFEGRYMTLVDPQTLEPLGLQVEGTYGEDRRWEKARFSDGSTNLDATFLYQGKEGTRRYDSKDPLTDLLTMLYFARTREMTLGTRVCQDVFGSRWLWRMRAEVERVAEVDTPAGTKDAVVVSSTFERAPHADAQNQRPVKYELDVFFARDRTQAPLAFVIRTDKVTAEGKLVRWSMEDRGEADWEL